LIRIEKGHKEGTCKRRGKNGGGEKALEQQAGS
jgi:hypothetical protein